MAGKKNKNKDNIQKKEEVSTASTQESPVAAPTSSKKSQKDTQKMTSEE